MRASRTLAYLAGASLVTQVGFAVVAWAALVALTAGFAVLRQPDLVALGVSRAVVALALGTAPFAILVAVPTGVAIALERFRASGELVAFATLRAPLSGGVFAIVAPALLFVPMQASLVAHAAPITKFQLWAATDAPSGQRTARLIPEIAEGLGGLGVAWGGVVDRGLTRVCVTRHASATEFAALRAASIEWTSGADGLGLRLRDGELWPDSRHRGLRSDSSMSTSRGSCVVRPRPR